jgi:flagellar motor switch protein FliN
MSSEVVVKFFEELAATLGATIGQLMATDVASKAVLSDVSTTHELWACAALQSEASCRMAVGLDAKTALLLARAMLSEAPAPDATLSDDDKELLVEFWKQALGRASTDLKARLSGVVLEYADAQLPEWQPAMTAAITLESAKGNVTLAVRLSMEMVRQLASNQTPEPAAVSAPFETSIPEHAAATAGNNLDLLLEVPLTVTLRFGQRRMPLRDILQLSSGSVIELDRHAEDAVDLLLDERLIARGQVVVVDGCYGLRVTEVCR